MTNNSWQRPSPIALLFYFFRTIKQIGEHSAQALAPLAVLVFSSDHKLFAILASLTLASLAILIAAFLQYWFFRYCIFPSELHIKYGVFKKQHRIIQFERVQNINIKLPFYFKPFKMVVLALDTAGSNNDEANLAGISRKNAENLRDSILSYKNDLKTEFTDDSVSRQSQNHTTTLTNENGNVIANASVKELAYYGFTNNQALFLAAIFTPFLEKIADDDSLLNFQPYIDKLGEHLGQQLATIAIMLTTIFVLFIVIQAVSIISAIVIHYKFRLTMFTDKENSPQKQKLICQGGLFSQYQKSLDLSKLQQIRQQASWQGQLLKVENLICHQLGNKKQNENLIIPARNKSQSQALLTQLLPNAPLTPPKKSISKHFIINKAIQFVLIPTTIILALLFNAQPPTISGYSFALIPMVLLPLIYIYWRKFKFDFYLPTNTTNGQSDEKHLADSYLVISKGLIGYSNVFIPLYKIQSVQIKQSYFQKRRHLANLKLYLATGSYTITFIPMLQAQNWFNQVNYYIHTSKRPWY